MIVFDNLIFADILASIAGTNFNTRADRCIARTEGGKLIGGVLVTGYTGKGGSCGMHAAGLRPDWINRDILWVTYDYQFNQLGVDRIIVQVPAYNTHSIAFCKKNGFKEKHRVEGVFPGGGDLLVMVMERADCRFLSIKPRGLSPGHTNGQQAESAAST